MGQMVRTYAYSANFDKETERLFRKAVFLGEGHNGIVYGLPENKAIKIFVFFINISFYNYLDNDEFVVYSLKGIGR